jgi:hypothetical protein
VQLTECIFKSEWEKLAIAEEAAKEALQNPKSDQYDWVIFDDGVVGAEIGKRLQQAFPNGEANPIWVTPGSSFQQVAKDRYIIQPEGIFPFLSLPYFLLIA